MASDLSFNIVALDRATTTFVKMAEQVDRLSQRIDKLDGKDATVSVNVRTDDSIKALDSFSNRFKLMAGAVVAASPLIGAGILAGVGTGIVGIAALAEKSNEDVKATYSDLWHNVVSETKAGADQVVPQIVGAGQMMNAEMQRLGPSIKQAFSFAGPDIIAITQGLNEMADNAMPGVVASMQQSLPVAEGVRSAMGQMGQTTGTALTSMSQHSQDFGRDIQSAGAIADGAVTAATGVVNTLGQVWAQNADSIDGSITSVGSSVSNLAQGAVPALSAGLGVVVDGLHAVMGIVEPLTPVLGTLGGIALATWAGFKAAGLAEAGIKALAGGVVTLGGAMEAGAKKAGLQIAAMKGVEVEASASARAITAAGAATATASVGFGAAASAIAGPLGFALIGGISLFSLFSGGADDSATSAEHMKETTDDLTSALVASKGAIDNNVVSALKNSDAFKDATLVLNDVGMSQDDLVNSITRGGPALDAQRKKLQAIIDANHIIQSSGDPGYTSSSDTANDLNDLGNAALRALNDLDALNGAYGNSSQQQQKLAADTHKAAVNFLGQSDTQAAAAQTANALGISLGDLNNGLLGVSDAGQAAQGDLGAMTNAFITDAMKVAEAEQAITDHFADADKAVVQAKQSVADASHSYAQSAQAIADAEHSLQKAHDGVVQAEQGVVDAHRQVVTAEQSMASAVDGERQAQVAVSAARRQAIQDLKDLRQQLEDQVVSESQARVRLFEAQQAAGGLTLDQAEKLANQKVTASNIEQIKAADDLLSAQNSLNEALSAGDQLRKKVADADKAGVDGAQNVVSAEQQLKAAHKQVEDAAYSLQTAKRNLTRAEQGVTDAAYAERRAQQQVADAQYQSARSAEQLRVAKKNLMEAQAADSRSLDLNTVAGRENLKLVLSLVDAINNTGLPAQQKYSTMVDDVAKSLGVSKTAAENYLKAIGKIDKNFHYGITAVAGVDWSSYEHTFSKATGLIRDRLGFAGGGHVVGPGNGTSDSIDARLSNGEFVVKASSTRKHRGLLELINDDAVPGFADGGMVDLLTGLGIGMAGASYTSNANAAKVMGIKHPAAFPKYVPPAEAAAGSAIPYNGPVGVKQWDSVILHALSMLGQSSAWLGVVERRMNQESGGNPTIVNKWDSNWVRGTPSVGLMQVIGPTFRAYAGPYAQTGPFSYGVSVNPDANTYAGLNYAIHRYGSLSALTRPGGYDSGGWLKPGGSGVNHLTQPEAVLTPEQSKAFVSLAKRGAGNTYVLNVYEAGNKTIDLVEQFRKLEAAAGMSVAGV